MQPMQTEPENIPVPVIQAVDILTDAARRVYRLDRVATTSPAVGPVPLRFLFFAAGFWGVAPTPIAALLHKVLNEHTRFKGIAQEAGQHLRKGLLQIVWKVFGLF
jgi:hypothetical protein